MCRAASCPLLSISNTAPPVVGLNKQVWTIMSDVSFIVYCEVATEEYFVLCLEICRRQGMRVGAAFSATLDPSRPSLFSDIGELALLPEEVWHRSALGAR